MTRFARTSTVLFLALCLSLGFAPNLLATNVQFQVTHPAPPPPPPPPPVDVCPNIPGIQTQVPPGMAIDANGNCYTPGPAVVDLCLNLPGIQTYIPEGYFRSANGNCYRQGVPPTDVCPNLPGTQTSVPDGYFLDPATNQCMPTKTPEPPKEDVCLNIPGIQTKTPPGMVNNDGYCYTPATPPPVPPTSTPSEPQGDQPLKNVPGWLQPFARFFVDLVPDGVKGFFRELPEDAVNKLPLIAFILILILILFPLLQSIREYLYRRKLIAFYKREQSIAEEKANFITLASHYLRTPITIMRDSVPLLLGAGEINVAIADTMNNLLNNLSLQVSAGIDIANQNPVLQGLNDPSIIKPKPFWRSGFFWLPLILSLILTVLANFLIGVVGDKEIGTNNALWQLFIIVFFIVILYLIVRNYHIQKKLRQQENALIEHEQAIDTTRNEFLAQQTQNIATALTTLSITSPSQPPSRPFSLYLDGLHRLQSVQAKFILLSQIKAGSSRDYTTFDLKNVIDTAISAEQQEIAAKQLTVQNSIHSTFITQNQPLFTFVITSVLDNAIKFANSGGSVLISSRPKDKCITVKISDNGKGIDPAKIDQLFKPFSRAESAVDFSYEGLGLSLFLNRLILNYTGGEISAAPRTPTGTSVIIITPTDISTQLSPLLDKKLSAAPAPANPFFPPAV